MITELGSTSFLLLCLLLGTNAFCCCRFKLLHQPTKTDHTPSSGVSFALSVLAEDTDKAFEDNIMADDLSTRKFLVHWRGEKDAGYSKPFRQLEFQNALAAELESLSIFSGSISDHDASKPDYLKGEIAPNVHFKNALNYTGNESMTDMNIEHFNEAMQFLSISKEIAAAISKETLIRAVERCSLIHALYEVVSSSDKLEDLAELAIRDGGFSDLYKGGANDKATWCFRARMYSESGLPEDGSNKGRGKRYSSRTRSMKIERDGLRALKDLLILFGGKVDLEDPDCKIYIFDGLEDSINGVLVPRKILARRIAAGPKVSILHSRS